MGELWWFLFAFITGAIIGIIPYLILRKKHKKLGLFYIFLCGMANLTINMIYHNSWQKIYFMGERMYIYRIAYEFGYMFEEMLYMWYLDSYGIIAVIGAATLFTILILFIKRKNIKRAKSNTKQQDKQTQKMADQGHCSHCGAEVKHGTVYCTNCGNKIR